jgi:hypothetical protein
MKLAFRLVVAAALALAASQAQAAYALTYVFTAVDAITIDPTAIIVTGVQQGASAPSTVTVQNYVSSSTPTYAQMAADSCRSMAITAMSRPGEFTFEIHLTSGGYPGCKLALVTP